MTTTPVLHTAGGVAIRVGHRPDAVAFVIGGALYRLEPDEAATIGQRLLDEAQNAIHAERLDRRTS